MARRGYIDADREAVQLALDRVARGQLTRRALVQALSSLGAVAMLGTPACEQALAAEANQRDMAARNVDTFELIVIGAGSAGAVVAARAAEDRNRTVAVVEAGPSDEGVASIADPSLWFTNIGSKFDWGYQYAPSSAVGGRRIAIPRGKVLGGSSSINALLWVRGAPSDYDRWSQEGAAGWAWADVLPYFRKAEDWQLGANNLRGAGGPLRCELPDSPHAIASGLVAAAGSLGLPVVEDVNGPSFGGASLANLNIKDGTRHNTARAYLRPALARPNLTLLTNTQATRLIIEGSRCVGVEVRSAQGTRTLRARQEVVLSAGALDSPRLLMLSGVGDPDELKRVGIPIVLGLRGVGRNLHDHPLLMGVNFAAKSPVPPFHNNAGGSQVFWKSRGQLSLPDIMVVPIQLPYASPEIAQHYPVPQQAFAVTPGLMRPQSRGQVRLLSPSPDGPFEIQPNFLEERADVEALMRAVDFCLELGAQPALRDLASGPVAPSRKLHARELEEFVRLSCSSYFHPVGTCKMGVAELSVVDPKLEVHGIAGLRIADASIMPRIPTANTHAACVMIGERAADLIQRGA